MLKPHCVTCVIALLALGACDDNDDGAGGGTGIETLTAGDGLTGGGSGSTVNVAVDYTKVSAKTHMHAWTEITGIPTAATAGATCPAGQKVTAFDVSTGRATCAADADVLGSLSCSAGQIPKRSGTAWMCADDATGGGGGGGVTSISTGFGLLGGPITSTGTIDIDFEKIARSDHGHPGLLSVVGPNELQTNYFLGIGNAPIAPLDVYGPAASIFVRNTAGGNDPSLYLVDIDVTNGPINVGFQRGNDLFGTIFLASDNSLAYQTLGGTHRFKISGSAEAMRIDGTTGNVGIGTNNPTQRLVVSDGTGPDAFCDGNSWVNASSRTAKEGIRTFVEDDYKTVRRWLAETDVVWYRYKGDSDPRTRVGLIAEDVPAVLATPDRKGISTADAIGFLTAATKELSIENERLRDENKALLERLARLEQRLDRVESR